MGEGEGGGEIIYFLCNPNTQFSTQFIV
jgi:hypothetical protein